MNVRVTHSNLESKQSWEGRKDRGPQFLMPGLGTELQTCEEQGAPAPALRSHSVPVALSFPPSHRCLPTNTILTIPSPTTSLKGFPDNSSTGQ